MLLRGTEGGGKEGRQASTDAVMVGS
jgi:hypothetical protein